MFPLGCAVLVAVINELSVGANLAVVTRNELEEAQDRALAYLAERKGRCGTEQVPLVVPAEAD